jgi:hypothetical protein
VLSLASAEILAVSVANGYDIASIEFPERRWRRSVVEAEDVQGDVETQSVLSSATYQVVVRCKGSSSSNVETKLTNLLTAFENRVYLLEVTLDGVTKTWRANRADSVTSAEKMVLHNFMREVTLRVPVQPLAP